MVRMIQRTSSPEKGLNRRIQLYRSHENQTIRRRGSIMFTSLSPSNLHRESDKTSTSILLPKNRSVHPGYHLGGVLLAQVAVPLDHGQGLMPKDCSNLHRSNTS